MVWYSHLFQNFPQFIVIHTVKGFGVVNKAEIGGSVVSNSPVNAGDAKDMGRFFWLGKIPWRRKWQPTSACMPGKFRGQRSLVGYNTMELRRVGHD